MRLAVILMITTCSWSQVRIDIFPVSGRSSDRLKAAEQRLRTTQQLSWRGPRSEEEVTVAKAVASLYRLYFQPEINSEPRIATLTEKGEDILVARWTPSGMTLLREVTVWDTPENTSFIFRLPVHSWSSDASIRSTFERLLLPGRSNQPWSVTSVSLNLARDAFTNEWIGAGGLRVSYPPRQFDVGYMNWLDFWQTTEASYLSVGFSQFATPGYPSSLRRIAERFPPLQVRVSQWSKKQILDGLGSGGGEERDLVLAQELVKRDLTEDELSALLLRRMQWENGALLQAVVEGNQVAHFSGTIRKYLEGDRGTYGKEPGPRAFAIVGRARDVNFTDVALAVLRQDVRSESAFQYAAAHGATHADYRALKALPPTEDAYMAGRDQALQRMRRRLGLDDAGNPIER